MPHTLPGSHRTRGFRSRSRPGLSRPTREPGSRRGRLSTASFRCPTSVSAPALRMLRAGALPPKKRSLEPNPLEKGVLLLQSVAGHGSCGWRGLSRFYGKMVRGPGGRTACFCPSTEGLQIRSGDGPKRADSGGCRARERGGTIRLEPSSEGSPGGANGERRGWEGHGKHSRKVPECTSGSRRPESQPRVPKDSPGGCRSVSSRCTRCPEARGARGEGQAASRVSSLSVSLSSLRQDGRKQDASAEDTSFTAELEALRKVFLARPDCPRFSTRATSMCPYGESHRPGAPA